MAGGRTNIATAGDQELQSVTAAKNMMAPADDFPDLTLSTAATLAPTTVLARLDVPLSGLTEAEAARRRDHFGPNAVHTHLVSVGLGFMFEDGLDVADPMVLDRVAATQGVERSTADVARVYVEWHEGQRRGVEGLPSFFVHGQRFFCPALDIRRDGERLEIERDEPGLERFLVVALG